MRQWLALCAAALAAGFWPSGAVVHSPRADRRFLAGSAVLEASTPQTALLTVRRVDLSRQTPLEQAVAVANAASEAAAKAKAKAAQDALEPVPVPAPAPAPAPVLSPLLVMLNVTELPAWLNAWTNLNKAQLYAAEALGWTQDTWDHDIPPLSSSRPWKELTGPEQEAAKELKWNMETWGTGDKSKKKGPLPAWTGLWANLTGSQMKRATELGWDQELWDGDVPPLDYDKPYKQLLEGQQEAVEYFGFTVMAWNTKIPMRPLCLQGTLPVWYAPWHELSMSQSAAAKILGWNETMWDTSWKVRPVNHTLFPESNSKPWMELEPREQAAALMFCWNSTEWLNADEYKGKGPPPLPLCNWTFDGEQVARPAECITLPNGNVSCSRSINKTFEGSNTSWAIECEEPAVKRCPHPTKSGEENLDPALYATVQAFEGDLPHGTEFDIVCNENATAMDNRYFLESWGQDWYPGVKIARSVCNNGTFMYMMPGNWSAEYTPSPSDPLFPGHPYYHHPGLRPETLRCELKERVKLHQDLFQYLRWTEPKMEEANTKGYKWIDVDALTHKLNLQTAMDASAKIEKESRNEGKLASIPDLKKWINALIDHRMIPHGEPMSQALCKDLEKHWIYELENIDKFKKAGNIGYANYVHPLNEEKAYPQAKDISLERPIDFSCSYTAQKAGAGFDPITRTTSWHYRDGCFCTSRWMGGCPFRAELSPNYRTFGFDALEIKGVSSALGAPTNSLCWYFTKPDHPEWGYLRSDLGYAYQAPLKNVTELKADWLKLKKLAQSARFNKS